jgi:hypothetical protein
MEHLDELEREGAMSWRPEEHAWVADPERVVRALTEAGFQEYRREVARDGHAHAPGGGMWQGLDPQGGVVATVIWVTHAVPQQAHVFIEIAGRWIEGRPCRPRPQAGTALSLYRAPGWLGLADPPEAPGRRSRMALRN